MSDDIVKIIKAKRQIYSELLDILESYTMGGGCDTHLTNINDNIKIIGTIDIGKINYDNSLHNKLNKLENGGKFTLSQAMENSFNRIKNNMFSS